MYRFHFNKDELRIETSAVSNGVMKGIIYTPSSFWDINNPGTPLTYGPITLTIIWEHGHRFTLNRCELEPGCKRIIIDDFTATDALISPEASSREGVAYLLTSSPWVSDDEQTVRQRRILVAGRTNLYLGHKKGLHGATDKHLLAFHRTTPGPSSDLPEFHVLSQLLLSDETKYPQVKVDKRRVLSFLDRSVCEKIPERPLRDVLHQFENRFPLWFNFDPFDYEQAELLAQKLGLSVSTENIPSSSCCLRHFESEKPTHDEIVISSSLDSLQRTFYLLTEIFLWHEYLQNVNSIGKNIPASVLSFPVEFISRKIIDRAEKFALVAMWSTPDLVDRFRDKASASLELRNFLTDTSPRTNPSNLTVKLQETQGTWDRRPILDEDIQTRMVECLPERHKYDICNPKDGILAGYYHTNMVRRLELLFSYMTHWKRTASDRVPYPFILVSRVESLVKGMNQGHTSCAYVDKNDCVILTTDHYLNELGITNEDLPIHLSKILHKDSLTLYYKCRSERENSHSPSMYFCRMKPAKRDITYFKAYRVLSWPVLSNTWQYCGSLALLEPHGLGSTDELTVRFCPNEFAATRGFNFLAHEPEDLRKLFIGGSIYPPSIANNNDEDNKIVKGHKLKQIISNGGENIDDESEPKVLMHYNPEIGHYESHVDHSESLAPITELVEEAHKVTGKERLLITLSVYDRITQLEDTLAQVRKRKENSLQGRRETRDQMQNIQEQLDIGYTMLQSLYEYQ